ncbi:hypothetical protein [Paenibacillus alkalitolerans]|uniref:hypothetical protein n=1 Tax=Paenibacillus alkalitolerans TaxID=2799335 RepID=UPI0018F33130|nr:hypothetical protein [Paenibacillus alkalitolerans]
MILTLFICLTLTLAIAAGAFYWGWKVAFTYRDAQDTAKTLEEAKKYIDQQDEIIQQLQHQNNIMSHEAELSRQKPPPSAWDTFNARQ